MGTPVLTVPFVAQPDFSPTRETLGTANPDVGKAAHLCEWPECFRSKWVIGEYCAGHYRPSPEFLDAERNRVATEKRQALQRAAEASV